MESFWTQQAQVLDMVQLGEYKDRFKPGEDNPQALLNTNRKAITLDANKAREFVDGIESHRELYRRLLAFVPHIRYYEVNYEDLKGPEGNHHWRALLAFLNVGSEQMTDKLQRVHPGTCGSKIANCEEVRKALKGTWSEIACDWSRVDAAGQVSECLAG